LGKVRKLPKRYQASYVGPDLIRVTGPVTFTTRLDAEAWRASESRLIESGTWTSPAQLVPLADYAAALLPERALKPRTSSDYRRLLDREILPGLGALPVAKLTPAVVRDWYSHRDPTKASLRSHAYRLLRTICTTAVDDELLPANPCRIRGAGQDPKRLSKTEPATPEELVVIVEQMPVRLRLMVLLAAWCAMRYGELAALRRSDVDVSNGVVRIRQGVTWIGGTAVVGPPTDAGIRDVAIPPHLLPAVREHIRKMPVTGKDALLFPTATDPRKHMPAARMFGPFAAARKAAGRSDLAFRSGRPADRSRVAKRPWRRCAPVITGELKSKIDRIWDAFWSGGISTRWRSSSRSLTGYSSGGRWTKRPSAQWLPSSSMPSIGYSQPSGPSSSARWGCTAMASREVSCVV
jgi:integrase